MNQYNYFLNHVQFYFRGDREAYLLDLTRDNAQLLINRIFEVCKAVRYTFLVYFFTLLGFGFNSTKYLQNPIKKERDAICAVVSRIIMYIYLKIIFKICYKSKFLFVLVTKM